MQHVAGGAPPTIVPGAPTIVADPPPRTAARARAGAAAVGSLLAAGELTMVFQPIVDLANGHTVAYEALARGPVGTPLHAPDALFAEARRTGLVSELDTACLRTAIETAAAGGFAPAGTLFVNIEPDSGCVPALRGHGADLRSPVVVELTERALTADPAALLATVAQIRQLGWRVALDDVGVNPDSLALLPLISPDVIKLDAHLIRRRPDRHTARVFSAVAAEAERSGCLLVAEGVETPAHLRAAHAMGARLAQGWLFGRPGPPPLRPTRAPIPLPRCPTVPSDLEPTPYGVAADARESRVANRGLLLAMSRHLERQAAAIGESGLVLAAFQTADAFTVAADRYAELADINAYVAVFGSGLSAQPAPGVRGIDLAPDDPLAQEWTVIIVAAHFAAVLAARLLDVVDGPDARWSYVLSHDRNLAVCAATTLMHHITRTGPVPAEVPAPG